MGVFLDNTGLAKLVELIKGSLPTKATSSTLGLVKPDNSTITVDSDGVISSSGGGTTYTAGSGISIDANDVISAYDKDHTTPLYLALMGYHQDVLGFKSNKTTLYNNSKVANFIDAIKAGLLVDIGANFNANGLGTALKELGYQRVLTIANDGTRTMVDITASNQANWKPSKDWCYWSCSNIILGVSAPYQGVFGKAISNNLYYDNIDSGLTATTIKGAIDEVSNKIPAAPTTDGNYVLKCSVVSGTPTYSWVSET